MEITDKKQLKTEIDHIFYSGANGLRIYDMVVNFIDSRYKSNVVLQGELKKQKEEIKQWLIDEDFETLAEKIQ